MSLRTASWVACLLLAGSGLVGADEPFSLKDGDRVVFYGDSITEQRLYTNYVETFAVTRFPKMRLDFVNAGWGGDRVTGGGGGPIDVRLARDVLAYKPTVVTIMLGMNDASYRSFDNTIFQTYSRGMEKIVGTLKAELPQVRLTLIQPSPFDDVTRPPVFEGGYNAVLLKYGEFLKALAAKDHLDLADLNTSVVAATKKALENDPQHAKDLNPDRVHPGPGGQLLMAAALLEAWHAPAIVTRVALTLEGETPSSVADRTEISALARKDGGISWTQTDLALPFPINLSDPATALAVRSSGFAERLDQQMLKIEGLDKERYTLAIDGKDVGEFARGELSGGVNLALRSTPMSQQANTVLELTRRHNELHATRWRAVEVAFAQTKSPNLSRALEALDALEDDIVKEQRAAAQPKPRRYELRPRS